MISQFMLNNFNFVLTYFILYIVYIIFQLVNTADSSAFCSFIIIIFFFIIGIPEENILLIFSLALDWRTTSYSVNFNECVCVLYVCFRSTKSTYIVVFGYCLARSFVLEFSEFENERDTFNGELYYIIHNVCWIWMLTDKLS